MNGFYNKHPCLRALQPYTLQPYTFLLPASSGATAAKASAAETTKAATAGASTTTPATAAAAAPATWKPPDRRNTGFPVPATAHERSTATTLAPLAAADPSLPDTLRVWLDSDGVYDVAARKLGIHRHTLRARVAEAERLLGCDLSGFAARADLYAALRAAR